jgi:hypothetical protein
MNIGVLITSEATIDKQVCQMLILLITLSGLLIMVCGATFLKDLIGRVVLLRKPLTFL